MVQHLIYINGKLPLAYDHMNKKSDFYYVIRITMKFFFINYLLLCLLVSFMHQKFFIYNILFKYRKLTITPYSNKFLPLN